MRNKRDKGEMGKDDMETRHGTAILKMEIRR